MTFDFHPDLTNRDFVGRESEINLIKNAIESDKALQVISIQGAGGVGKTSLLRNIQESFRYSEEYLITDIIDFFEISTHTQIGFCNEIIRQISFHLPEFDGCFKEYKEIKKKQDELVHSEAPSKKIEEIRKKTKESFWNNYNKISNLKRIVLPIDTFEIVQSFMGEIVAEIISGFKNTVVIVAGRKNKDWYEDVIRHIDRRCVIPYELSDFTFEETQELFTRTQAGQKISKEEINKLHILSRGRPVLLTTVLDLRQHYSIPANALSHTSASYKLADLAKKNETELYPIRKQFEKEIIDYFYNEISSPHFQAISYMAIGYKLFKADTLALLIEINYKEAVTILEELKEWNFIKYDHETQRFQLHDLFRDMVIEYFWDILDPFKEERQHICKIIHKCYEQSIQDIHAIEKEYRSSRKQAQKTNDKNREIDIRNNLSDLKIQRQQLEAQQVYYAIVAEPDYGIKLFEELYVHYLWSKEVEAHPLLRQERDEALRYIGIEYPEKNKQLMEARELIIIDRKYEKSMIILDILHQIERKENNDESLYFHADIHLYRGNILLYKGEYELSLKNLDFSINILGKLIQGLKEPKNFDDMKTRRVYRSLARCYCVKGFLCLMWGRMRDAKTAFYKGMPFTKTGRFEMEQSFFLNDMGYVLSRLGDFDSGIIYWKQAFEIRENLIINHLIGLSYNTRGLMEYFAQNPYTARIYSERALDIFDEIGEERGKGQAHRTLGGIFAMLGKLEAKTEYLLEANFHLEKAEKIFRDSSSHSDRGYYAETLERFGLMYRYLLGIQKEKGVERSQLEQYFILSESFFKESLEWYEKLNSVLRQSVTFCMLSNFYIENDQLSKAEEALKQLENILIREKNLFKLLQSEFERNIPFNAIEIERKELLLPLGLFQRALARLHYKRFEEERKTRLKDPAIHLEKSAKHYALACAILETFSTSDINTTKTVNEVLEIIINKLRETEKEMFSTYIQNIIQEYGLKESTKLQNKIAGVIII